MGGTPPPFAENSAKIINLIFEPFPNLISAKLQMFNDLIQNLKYLRDVSVWCFSLSLQDLTRCHYEQNGRFEQAGAKLYYGKFLHGYL